MKVSYNPSESTQAWLKNSGVPPGLSNQGFSFDLAAQLSSVQIMNRSLEKPVATISAAKQVELFDRVLKSEFTKPFVLVINAVGDFLQARRCAILPFWQALQQARKNSISLRAQIPQWHFLLGGWKNDLIEQHKRGEINEELLLVLDGLDTKMSETKVEKSRDILNYFSDRPRIVLISGKHGTEFVRDTLHVKSTATLLFAPERKSLFHSEQKRVQL